MIEVLLVIIIALICLAIYGYTYYTLNLKKKYEERSCPVSECPKCPDCNVECPQIPVCPECKTCVECPKSDTCPECPECPEYPESHDSNGKDTLMLGFKLKTKSSTVKELIHKINQVNNLQQKYFV